EETNDRPVYDLLYLSPGQHDSLDSTIARAQQAQLLQQNAAGFWCYELEADCTIPAEYILMMHFMDEIEPSLQTKIANYLRQHQQSDGGWSLYFDGPFDVSCSVKSYYALKLAGDSPDAAHMCKARIKILAAGGAACSNVFTMLRLAMFQQIPWRAVPIVPVEIMFFPRWFPFHLSKVAYWSRTVMIPLSILCTYKAKARNPQQIGISELFSNDPWRTRLVVPIRSNLNRLFVLAEKFVKLAQPLVPKWVRRRATAKAEAWIVERLNGDGGLGAIFPAMVNAYEVLDHLGYGAEHPLRINAKKAIDDLLVVTDDTAYCQPCNSPIWDTGLACLALQEVGEAEIQVNAALDWLQTKQLLEQKGDWREQRPHLRGGGWAFQFRNDHYPDLDDTAVVAWAMQNSSSQQQSSPQKSSPQKSSPQKSSPHKYKHSIERAAEWLQGMQSSNGGFASFEIDNTFEILNEIPFADHGALLDPPSADVSARCVSFLCTLEQADKYRPTIERCLEYLAAEQEESGAWFGRWGTNYIYGTWSVLVALEHAGIDKNSPMITRAVTWLKSCQRRDGSWGESDDSYFDASKAGLATQGTTFQTAWAMLGLMAAGDRGSFELHRAATYLCQQYKIHGQWQDASFTAPGFPRVFHLKYHSYNKIFPLWALAKFRNLKKL
ncbi:MAG: squalene--hopene cyclase, partial [Thiohalomonadales bacterium]